MTYPILMPKMGMDMLEGTVSRWLKTDGEVVRAGEVVAEVENNKITNEVPAEADGRLSIVVPEAGTCAVGQPIALILAVAAAVPETASARVRASPIARRLAAEFAVPLAALAGTGPGGRVLERDVLAYRDAHPRAPTAPPSPPTALSGQPASRMRLQIAERMQHSLQAAAQLTFTATADVTQLLATRAKLAQKWGRPLSLTALLAKATVTALQAHPQLAARLEGDRLVFPTTLHLGVAVALEDGLIVPVVRSAERLALPALAERVQQLVTAAQHGQLSAGDVGDGHFTLTNLGRHRVEWFTPILNPPETGILGIGRIAPGLALYEGAVVARSHLPLSLTVDHRVVDGEPAAAFLDTLIEALETPALLLA